jgi:hypothetical protein
MLGGGKAAVGIFEIVKTDLGLAGVRTIIRQSVRSIVVVLNLDRRRIKI